MKQCRCCGGSGRLWFGVSQPFASELPPGCSFLFDNGAVMKASDFEDPDYPLESADMLAAKIIAFELDCPDCDGQGFLETK